MGNLRGANVAEAAGVQLGWIRKKLTIREAAATGIILGLYTSVLTYIGVLYAPAFQDGFILGIKIAGIGGGIIFTIAFLNYSIYGRKIRKAVDNTATLIRLRSILGPIEVWAAESMIGDQTWLVDSHIRPSDNKVAIDLHDLDVRSAISLIEIINADKANLGRIQLITGRGKSTSQNPAMRPAISNWLRENPSSNHWHVMRKPHAITLRPLPPPLGNKELMIRMTAFGAPIGAFGAIGFNDAANGIPGAGVVGFIAGLFLTYLMVTHSH